METLFGFPGGTPNPRTLAPHKPESCKGGGGGLAPQLMTRDDSEGQVVTGLSLRLGLKGFGFRVEGAYLSESVGFGDVALNPEP